jgi:hypothetical protein
MGVIEWIPISELPEAFKDGRDVLVWEDRAMVCHYHAGRWWLEGEVTVDPTAFAEINPPGDSWVPEGMVQPGVMK